MRMNSRTLPSYARLLTTLIENTAQRDLLGGTVGRHVHRAIEGHRHGHVEQADEESPEWKLMKKLLPEALDPFVRHRPESANALPEWAR